MTVMRRWRRAGGRYGAVAALAMAAAAAATPELGAQAKVGCLRGRPLPECRSFWLIEMQGIAPLVQTDRQVSYGGGMETRSNAFDQVLEWNLGHMVNLTPTFAVGGVFTVGSGGSDALTGVRARGRRWMSKDVSLELGGGLLRTTARGAAYAGVNGATVDLRLNIRDQGSFFVRWDGLSLPEVRQTGDWTFYDPGGFQQGLSVGASAGSVPALIGTGALGLAWTILFALFWVED